MRVKRPENSRPNCISVQGDLTAVQVRIRFHEIQDCACILKPYRLYMAPNFSMNVELPDSGLLESTSKRQKKINSRLSFPKSLDVVYTNRDKSCRLSGKR